MSSYKKSYNSDLSAQVMRHRASVALAMQNRDYGLALFHMSQLLVVLPPKLQKICKPIYEEANQKISQAAAYRDSNDAEYIKVYQEVEKKLVVFPTPHYVRVVHEYPKGMLVQDKGATLYERMKFYNWTCTMILTAAMGKIMSIVIDNGIFDSIGQREEGVAPAVQPRRTQ